MGYRRAILWRHGQTTWNRERRFQGQLDVPLDDTGLQQAEAAAEILRHTEQLDLIVSSDLTRAARTAQILGEAVGIEVAVDPDLREANAGEWQGMTHEEILAADAPLLHRWRTTVDTRPGRTGETRTEVGARVAGAVHRHVGALEPGGTAVVVTHGGAARAAVGHLLGLPPLHWHTLGVMRNCAWAVLELDDDDRWRLDVYNTAADDQTIAARRLGNPGGAVRDAIV